MDQHWRLESAVLADRLAGALVYCLLGLGTTTIVGTNVAGPQDVFRLLYDIRGATFFHGALAIALMILGACRLRSTIFDSEYSRGRPKDEIVRFMRMGGGAGYLLLGAIVLGFAVDVLGSASVGRYAAEALLGTRASGAWLTFIGMLFFVAAAYQIANAWMEDLPKRFVPDVPAWVVPLQGAGVAACADVSFIIGYAFVRAGWLSGPGGLTGLDDVLAELVENTELNILLAFALLLSGICSFAVARWRTIVSERPRPLHQGAPCA